MRARARIKTELVKNRTTFSECNTSIQRVQRNTLVQCGQQVLKFACITARLPHGLLTTSDLQKNKRGAKGIHKGQSLCRLNEIQNWSKLPSPAGESETCA